VAAAQKKIDDGLESLATAFLGTLVGQSRTGEHF